MNRSLKIVISYAKTAIWSMVVGSLFFFFYSAVRAAAPLPSIFWYGIAVGSIVVIVTFAITTQYAQLMAITATTQMTDIITSLRMSRKSEQAGPVESVSFVIPIFNEAQSLPMLVTQLDRFVNDLCSQNSFLRKVEIIFVNDASTDNTAQQLEKYLRPLESTVVLKVLQHTEPKGLIESQRTGITAATGELVLSLDAQSLQFIFNKQPRYRFVWQLFKLPFSKRLRMEGRLARSALGSSLH